MFGCFQDSSAGRQPEQRCLEWGLQALCKNSGSTLGYGFGSSSVDLEDKGGGPDDGEAPRAPLVEAVA